MNPATQQVLDRMIKQVVTYQPAAKEKLSKKATKGSPPKK